MRRVHVAAFLEYLVQSCCNGSHFALSSPPEFPRDMIIAKTIAAASQQPAHKRTRRAGQSSRCPERTDQVLNRHALTEIRIDKSGPDYSILADDESRGDG